MRLKIIRALCFILAVPSICQAEFYDASVTWQLEDRSNVQGYAVYYSYSKNMESKEFACSTDDPKLSAITCKDISISRFPVFFKVEALLPQNNLSSTTVDLISEKPKIFNMRVTTQ